MYEYIHVYIQWNNVLIRAGEPGAEILIRRVALHMASDRQYKPCIVSFSHGEKAACFKVLENNIQKYCGSIISL
jgi:hypothetical protein